MVMAITLTPELEAIVREDATLCGFDNVETYLAERLMAMHEQERFFTENRQEISTMIDEGWAQAEDGELLSPEEAKRNLSEWKQQFLAKRSAA